MLRDIVKEIKKGIKKDGDNDPFLPKKSPYLPNCPEHPNANAVELKNSISVADL